MIRCFLLNCSGRVVERGSAHVADAFAFHFCTPLFLVLFRRPAGHHRVNKLFYSGPA